MTQRSSTGRVFLVVRVDWEDQSVVSVWSSRELAEVEAERLKQETGYEHFEVDEHVVDVPRKDPW